VAKLELYGRLHADFFNSYKVPINCVDMNINLTRAPEAFYFLAPSVDNKVRIKIVVANPFITQVELKLPLLAHTKILGMKRKAHYPVTILRLKPFLRVLGPISSLSIMNSLDQFQKFL